MFAYVVVDAKILDLELQKQYGAKAASVVAKFGGEYLARGGKLSVKEIKRGTPARLVIVKFPSYEQAENFYNSPEYQEALLISDKAAERTFSIVEGV